MRATQARIRDVVRRRRPRGWRVVERPATEDTLGLALISKKTIYVPPLDCAESLFIFLHECGHIHHGHLHNGDTKNDPPGWLEEYEAETWAIKAMRSEGLSVSRKLLQEARDNVRHRIEECLASGKLDLHLERFDESALRFADPRGWRRWI